MELDLSLGYGTKEGHYRDLELALPGIALGVRERLTGALLNRITSSLRNPG